MTEPTRRTPRTALTLVAPIMAAFALAATPVGAAAEDCSVSYARCLLEASTADPEDGSGEDCYDGYVRCQIGLLLRL